jgi:zinc/manganese transport system substrate-binding protein
VQRIGGDHVRVVTLVGPDGDAHVYQPTPGDARDVADADLVVVNGLGFEGWFDRLVEASGFAGQPVIASAGITPLTMAEEEAAHEDESAHAHEAGEEHVEGEHDADEHDHGGVDPHAWQSAANAEIYVRNIASALCKVDAAHCDDFTASAAAYSAEIEDLDASIKRGFAAIPEERRIVITSHDAFGYFGRAYGVEFLAPQGMSTESEASAADIAKLIEQIRHEGATALFVENISDPRLIEQIARETAARVGGALYSDALSGPRGPAPTYVDMMRHNANSLLAAMQGS